jgi:hypothetical protein
LTEFSQQQEEDVEMRDVGEAREDAAPASGGSSPDLGLAGSVFF